MFLFSGASVELIKASVSFIVLSQNFTIPFIKFTEKSLILYTSCLNIHGMDLQLVVLAQILNLYASVCLEYISAVDFGVT